MPLTSFRVTNNRAIKLAECKQVPKIMVIAGANGVGKSTLLSALKARTGVQGTGNFLYIAPHRVWSRKKVRAMYLLSRIVRWSEMISADSTLGIDGLDFRGFPRRFDYLDESPSAIKHLLGQIEVRRSQIITAMYDRGTLSKDSIPDVYEPLRRLVEFLLPHLRFERVDLSSREDIKCLFSLLHHQQDSGYLQVDIDELSSGEREVIMLFWTFIEQQINKILSELEGSVTPPQDMVMLIDTPELHLHPELQSRLLEYLRDIVGREGIQFIMTTQSPVLVNDATPDELYTLTHPEPLDEYNQLVKITSQSEKLELARSISGNTFLLTTGKPIVFIEGVPPEEASKRPSDRRLVELICPDFSQFVLIPFRDRDRIVALIRDFTRSPEISGLGLKLFAVLDNDRGPCSDLPDRVFVWPVCNIENFLLDHEAIWGVLEPHREKLGWNGPSDVLNTLNEIATAFKDEEIKLRVAERLGHFKWDARGKSVDEIIGSYDEGLEKLRGLREDYTRISSVLNSVQTEVEEIEAQGKQLQLFDGKRLLRLFHAKYVGSLGLNYQAFVYQVAREIHRRGAPQGLLNIKKKVEVYVPSSLSATLADIQRLLKEKQIESGLPEGIRGILEDATKRVGQAIQRSDKGELDKKTSIQLKKFCWNSMLQLRQELSKLATSRPEIREIAPLVESAIAQVASIMV